MRSHNHDSIMDSIPCQWSDLLSDLLRKIARCLESRVDVLRLRGVCHSWRCSVPLPPTVVKLPYPISDRFAHNPESRGHFKLTESTVYSLQPVSDPETRPWIVRLQSTESGRIIFKDLLSDAPTETVETRRLPKILNLLDYRINHVANAYSLEFVDQRKHRSSRSRVVCAAFTRIAVSSSFNQIADDLTVMVLKRSGKLIAWRMGDDSWTKIDKDAPEWSVFRSVVYHRGEFYAVGDTGRTVAINPLSFKIREVAPAKTPSCSVKYLVKSSEDLYLVERSYETSKLDEAKHEWVEEEDGFEGRMLLIGRDWSFLLPAKHCTGYRGDRVYFPSSESFRDHPGSDIVIFYMKRHDGRLWCLYSRCSKLFWPPPTWLQSKPVRFSN